eukprot:8570739-Alexandrium_andersonii.AAC.1
MREKGEHQGPHGAPIGSQSAAHGWPQGAEPLSGDSRRFRTIESSREDLAVQQIDLVANCVGKAGDASNWGKSLGKTVRKGGADPAEGRAEMGPKVAEIQGDADEAVGVGPPVAGKVAAHSWTAGKIDRPL